MPTVDELIRARKIVLGDESGYLNAKMWRSETDWAYGVADAQGWSVPRGVPSEAQLRGNGNGSSAETSLRGRPADPRRLRPRTARLAGPPARRCARSRVHRRALPPQAGPRLDLGRHRLVRSRCAARFDRRAPLARRRARLLLQRGEPHRRRSCAGSAELQPGPASTSASSIATGMDLADALWIDALLAVTKGDDVVFLDSWTDLWSRR